MIWSGGMAWIADFPDPSDFYGPILGCGGAVPGRLELVVVLQQGSRREGRRGRRHGRSGEAATSATKLWSDDLRQDHGGRALGAGLQRAALHHELRAHGRRRQRSSSIRSTSRSTTTMCTSTMCNKLRLHHPRAPSSFRLGQFVSPRPSGSRPGRRSSSSASMPRAASFRPTAPSPTSPSSTSARSIR